MDADAPVDRVPRAPQQQRGQRRVAQILDAAAEVFLEHGVGGATMQLIAERAGASAGSLYHFFPNKDAVLESLCARYADRVRRLNEEAMPLSLVHLEPHALFDRVLRGQMLFLEETPAFGVVQEAVARNCPVIHDALNQAVVGHVGQFLALRYPRMPVPQRLASAMVSVATVRAIVDLAGRLPPAMREPVLREGHAMLVAHYGKADTQFGVGPMAGGEGGGAAPVGGAGGHAPPAGRGGGGSGGGGHRVRHQRPRAPLAPGAPGDPVGDAGSGLGSARPVPPGALP